MFAYITPTLALPLGDCVVSGEKGKVVMLNQVLNLIQDLRFQHLIKSNGYETLK
jgi:hypothetical protein